MNQQQRKEEWDKDKSKGRMVMTPISAHTRVKVEITSHREFKNKVWLKLSNGLEMLYLKSYVEHLPPLWVGAKVHLVLSWCEGHLSYHLDDGSPEEEPTEAPNEEKLAALLKLYQGVKLQRDCYGSANYQLTSGVLAALQEVEALLPEALPDGTPVLR